MIPRDERLREQLLEWCFSTLDANTGTEGLPEDTFDALCKDMERAVWEAIDCAKIEFLEENHDTIRGQQ